MRYLILFVAVAVVFALLFALPTNTASGAGTSSGYTNDLGAVLAEVWHSGGTAAKAGIDFLDAVGNITRNMANQLSNACLGSLTCLVLPLSILGLWTLRNFGRILRVLQFQDSSKAFWN